MQRFFFFFLAILPGHMLSGKGDTLKVVNAGQYKGDILHTHFRTISCDYPADWEMQVIDSIEVHRAESKPDFRGFRISFFPPGPQTYSCVEIAQEGYAEINDFAGQIKGEIKHSDDGRIIFYHKRTIEHVPSFDIVYSWTAPGAYGGKITYVHYTRYLVSDDILFKLNYAGFAEDFNHWLPAGKLIMDSFRFM